MDQEIHIGEFRLRITDIGTNAEEAIVFDLKGRLDELTDSHIRVLRFLAHAKLNDSYNFLKTDEIAAGANVSCTSVGNCLTALKKALGERAIKNKSGHGYRLELPVSLLNAESGNPARSQRRAEDVGLSATTILQGSVPAVASSDIRPHLFPDTKLFWEMSNMGRRADGGAVEISAHFNLTHASSLAEAGWSPEQVRLIEVTGNFDAGEVLRDADITAAFEQYELGRAEQGKLPILDPLNRNGVKFVVVNISPNVDERDDLTIALRRTDYVTIMRALPGITTCAHKRRQYGNPDPALNKIPNALGLHFTAVLADGNILTMLRENVDYYPNTWSFSGEEQFKDSDLSIDEQKGAEHFLLRAAAEEIFPLAGAPNDTVLKERMDRTRAMIRSMRVWSVLVDEPSVSFSLFGVIELGLTTDGYRNLLDEMLQTGQGSGEGRTYVVALQDATRLFRGDRIAATAVWGHGQKEVTPDALHPTSRYRLGLLLEVLSRMSRA